MCMLTMLMYSEQLWLGYIYHSYTEANLVVHNFIEAD